MEARMISNDVKSSNSSSNKLVKRVHAVQDGVIIVHDNFTLETSLFNESDNLVGNIEKYT
jgi:hypothetical protein